MKFEDTILWRVLALPKEMWDKNCLYVFLLKLPVFVFLLILWGVSALVMDFIFSTIAIFEDLK